MVKKLLLMQQRRKIQRQKGDDHKFWQQFPLPFWSEQLILSELCIKRKHLKKNLLKITI